MKFEPPKEYIEAVLLLRGTAQLDMLTAAWRAYRDQLLLTSMDVSDEMANKFRQRAAGVTEILTSIHQIEQLRQQFENNGDTTTGQESRPPS